MSELVLFSEIASSMRKYEIYLSIVDRAEGVPWKSHKVEIGIWGKLDKISSYCV